jgi:hypothetical protein
MSWSFRDRRSRRRGRCFSHRFWAVGLVIPTVVAVPAKGRVEPTLVVDMAVLASPNPLLLSGGHRGAVMIEVAASPGIIIRTPTGSTLDVSGTIRNRRYSRRYGHYLLGDFRMEGRYRDSEYLTVGAAAGYGRALAIDLLTSSADASGDPRGIRNSWFAGFDAAWRPDAYSLITPEFRFERATYSDSDLLRDASALTISLAWSRRIGPLTSIGLRARDTMNEVSGMAGMNSSALYLTLNRQLGERARFLAELGVERTGRQIEWLDGSTMRRPGRTLLAGRVDLCREGEERWQGLTGCLSAALNSEVSGFGGLRRDAILSVTVSQPLGERFVLRGVSEYRHSSLIGGSSGVGPPGDERDSATDAVRNMLMLDWKLRPEITLTGTVQYLRRQLVTGRRIGAGFFGIQLRYEPRLRK